MLTHREIIEALIEGSRRTLGRMATPDQIGVAQHYLAEQCQVLIDRDGQFSGAIRMAVIDRLTPLFTDPDLREKVMTDNCDPDHAFWLLVCPTHILRHFARHKSDGPKFRTFDGVLVEHIMRRERPEEGDET